MNVMESIGMMSTGALLAIGGYVGYDKLTSGPETTAEAPEQTVLFAPSAPEPVAQPQSLADVTQGVTDPTPSAFEAPVPAVPELAEPVQVSRNQTDLGGFSTAAQLRALSLEPEPEPEMQLTAEQQEAIRVFERAARDFNASSTGDRSRVVRFSNMAINGLQVRYFYTIGRRFDQIDVATTMQQQEEFVLATICDASAIRVLMEDYGFDYSYTYVSEDSRMVGEVTGDIASCG